MSVTVSLAVHSTPNVLPLLCAHHTGSQSHDVLWDALPASATAAISRSCYMYRSHVYQW